MLAIQKRLLALMVFTLIPTLSAFAQQGSSWQGSRVYQPPLPGSAQQPPATPVPQPSLPLNRQSDAAAVPQPSPFPREQLDETRPPQVLEMPAAQAAPSQTPQLTAPAAETATGTQNTPLSAKPPYLGLVGKTAPACRYPAGVRVSQVIEGSPAHLSGIQGEATLTWKQAMTAILAMSPAALLLPPTFTTSEHGGRGDLILAVDGQRVHDMKEFAQEMNRFRTGDTIYFSIFRETYGLRQVPVRLTEFPGSPSAMLQ